MNLDDLLNEMSEKIRNRDLSDEYLREHNNSTREEIGIGEYAYGITMIPCEWVYEYLSEYKRVLKENQELKNKLKEKDKIIDLMAVHLIGATMFDNDEPIIFLKEEKMKQYFEKQAKNDTKYT